MSRCSHYEETCSQLRLEVSYQRVKHEAQLEGVRAKVQRLKDELSTRKWDQTASESQLTDLQRQLQESSSFLSTKAKEVDELKCQIADLESELAAKGKTIIGLKD